MGVFLVLLLNNGNTFLTRRPVPLRREYCGTRVAGDWFNMKR